MTRFYIEPDPNNEPTLFRMAPRSMPLAQVRVCELTERRQFLLPMLVAAVAQ